MCIRDSYRTCSIGKYHLAPRATYLFQEYRNKGVQGTRTAVRMARNAREWIAEDDKKPFFLYFPMCPPHSPIVPAPDFVGKSGLPGKEGKYADWVYQGDHMLGELLDALERSGQAKNTLVIATGDNGAAKRPYPPLREAKSSIYEGGHREPFVARWPGKIKPGSVNDQTICLNDLFATCADILGAKLPENAAEDSRRILSCLLGTATGPVREATIHQAPGGLAIRQGPWKLVSHRSGEQELFNLESDISETKNVAPENQEVVKHLAGLMQSYINRGRSTPGAVQKNEFDLSVSFGGKDNKKKRRRKARKQE